MTMNQMTAIIKRHPLAAYFVLAYAFAWSLVLLTRVSVVFGFLALFGPAAMIVTAHNGGRAGVGALLRSVAIWRVGPRWYVVALGLPAMLSLGAVGLSLALGAPSDVHFSELSPLTAILFILSALQQ
jgi:uncharacterized protein